MNSRIEKFFSEGIFVEFTVGTDFQKRKKRM